MAKVSIERNGLYSTDAGAEQLTLRQENEGMPGALFANDDGFEFPQNAVNEAWMVCRAQGRGLRRDTSQISCDLACVLWKLVLLPAKETSHFLNAIRQLFVPCEWGALAAA